MTTNPSAPRAYLVVMYHEVSDADALARYAEAASPVLAAFGGRVLTRGGRIVSLEGGSAERTNVVEFPNVDKALAFYQSDDYQAARAALGDAAARDVRIAEGPSQRPEHAEATQ